MKLKRIINNEYFYVPFLTFIVLLFLYVFFAKIPGIVWGAIVAGVIGFLTYWGQRLAETSRNRYDTLVRLEQQLNSALADLSSNKKKIRDATETEAIYLLLPRRVEIDRRDIQEIGRAELKNMLFSLSVAFRAYNESLEGTIRTFEKDQLLLTDTAESPLPLYRERILLEARKQYQSRLKKIQEYGDGLAKDVKGALVRVRFFIHNDRSKILQHLTTKYYDEQDYKKWLKIDMERLEKEMSEEKAKGKIEEASD